MSKIQLYMAPGTCARVPCIALEEACEDFETVVIRFMRGEHKSPELMALNPKAKVPVLVVDGEPLTENVAIITYLNQRYPEARLMPQPKDELERLRQLADLSFCSSTMHPIVTRIRMPQFFAAKDAAKSVWEKGCESMNENFALVNKRLTDQPWWYGDDWSAMDAYLYWIYWRCEGADYDVTPYSNYQAQAERMESRPATKRALAREAEAQAQLEAEGLTFKPPSNN